MEILNERVIYGENYDNERAFLIQKAFFLPEMKNYSFRETLYTFVKTSKAKKLSNEFLLTLFKSPPSKKFSTYFPLFMTLRKGLIFLPKIYGSTVFFQIEIQLNVSERGKEKPFSSHFLLMAFLFHNDVHPVYHFFLCFTLVSAWLFFFSCVHIRVVTKK